MKGDIVFEITIPNETRYLGLLGRIGENMAKELDRYEGDREELANRINTVLTEALVNAIKHANPADTAKEILVRIRISAKELAIRVFDSGDGFDLKKVPDPCVDSDLLKESGLGLFIIRSLMDSVVYRKANGRNVLEMKKAL